MKMARMIALAIPIAFLLMSFARPAAAMKPEVTETTSHATFTYIDCSTVKPEWAFKVNVQGDDIWRVTTYFDNNGNVDRVTYSEHWTAMAWNSVTGLTVKDDANWHETYYPATNTWAVDGHMYNWVIHGQGRVLIETGHSVWYWIDAQNVWLALKEHGSPHDLSSVYWIDYTPMCAALA